MVEEEKKKKKWKQGIGGVEWEDLIWPAIGGVAASFNNDVARGVGHANAIFRTLQEERTNREAQEAYRRILEPRIADLRQRAQRGTDETDRVDLSSVWTPTYYGETGPVLPKAGRFSAHLQDLESESLLQEPQAPRQFSLDLPASALSQRPMDGLQSPLLQPGVAEGAGPLALPEKQQFALGMPDIQMQGPLTGEQGLPPFGREEILGGVGERPDWEQATDQLRTYETLLALSGVNPSAAGYLMGQMEISNLTQDQEIDLINKKLTAAGINRRDKQKLDLYTNEMHAALKQDNIERYWELRTIFEETFGHRYDFRGQYVVDKVKGTHTKVIPDSEYAASMTPNQLWTRLSSLEKFIATDAFAEQRRSNPKEAARVMAEIALLREALGGMGFNIPMEEPGADGGTGFTAFDDLELEIEGVTVPEDPTEAKARALLNYNPFG